MYPLQEAGACVSMKSPVAGFALASGKFLLPMRQVASTSTNHTTVKKNRVGQYLASSPRPSLIFVLRGPGA